ncbi:hypothetical protein LDENG_00072160 [Lucifuga dentata]|nr:hypothetical protein LDENG_00072160 [Lucifuga dentata]
MERGGTVAQWLALLPHSKQVLGSRPTSSFLCGVCMFSLCGTYPFFVCSTMHNLTFLG